MRKAITIVIVIAAGLLLRLHFQHDKEREAARIAAEQEAAEDEDLLPEPEEETGSRFDTRDAPRSTGGRKCDGRKRCPQMHSCDEATWFIENCPGMEMDGDNDGVPCETQWCR